MPNWSIKYNTPVAAKTVPTLREWLHNGLSAFLDFLFPKPELVRQLERLTPGEFLEIVPRQSASDNNTLTLFPYRNSLVETAVWELKYRRNEKVARLLAALLHETLLDELAVAAQFKNFSSPVLVPIPASKRRLKEHGYDQCEFLAKLLGEIDGGINFKIENLLVKIKETASQTSLSGRSMREKNVLGSFGVTGPKRVRGRNIILLDDVTTTGSTIREATRALRGAGAKQVLAITIAH